MKIFKVIYKVSIFPIILSGCIPPMMTSQTIEKPEEQKVVYVPQRSLAVSPSKELMRTAGVYRVGKRDVLEIRIWNQPELSGPYRVNENGKIKLPLVGELKVAGYGVEEITSILEKRFADYIKNPQILVAVKEYAAKKVYLLGEVKNPGVYPLLEPTTTLQLISMAGGFNPTALLEASYIIRSGKVYPVNLQDVLFNGEVKQNFYLEDGDIIFIPGVNFMRVFVLGSVKNPGEVPMTKRDMTVLEALSYTGGIEIGGLEDDVKIIRGWPNNPEMFSVNVEEILKGNLSTNTSAILKPGDIVYVPKSKLKSLNEVLQLIQPAVSMFITTPLNILVDSLYVKERWNR